MWFDRKTARAKKFVKPMEVNGTYVYQFHEFSLDWLLQHQHLKKGKVKDETSRKIRKPMEVKLSNDSLLGNARANGADLSM